MELDLLKKLITVCRENGLRCWAEGGTLLGAVRHKGFIPWDDDVDVCMPREDYDRLLTIGGKAFQSPYFLQSAYSDVEYYRGHAQLRLDGTAAVRPSDSYRAFHQGIFIDIFPLDGVPEDPQELADTMRFIMKRYKFLKAGTTSLLYSGRWGLLFRKLKSKWAVRRYGWQNLYAETEERLRSHSLATCDKWAELSFGSGLFDRQIFDETLWMDFEDIKIPVPAGYDAFLRTQFGDDYMTPVKAPSCHGELVFDLGRSYKEVCPEVWKCYKRSLVRRFLEKIKG